MGGDWASDDDDKEQKSNTISDLIAIQGELSPRKPTEDDPQRFIDTLLRANSSWPVHLEEFISMCRTCTLCNSIQLLNKLVQQIRSHLSQVKTISPRKEKDSSSSTIRETIGHDLNHQHNLLVLLLFIEISINEDLIILSQMQVQLDEVLKEVYQSNLPNTLIKTKAKKIYLILKGLLA